MWRTSQESLCQKKMQRTSFMGDSPRQHLNCSWHNHPSWSLIFLEKFKAICQVSHFFFWTNSVSFLLYSFLPLGSRFTVSRLLPESLPPCIYHTREHTQLQGLSPFLAPSMINLVYFSALAPCLSVQMKWKKIYKTKTSHFFLAVKVLLLPVLPYPRDLITSNWFRAHQTLSITKCTDFST